MQARRNDPLSSARGGESHAAPRAIGRAPHVALSALGVVALAACGDRAPSGEASAALTPEVVTPIAPGDAGLEAFLDCLSRDGVTLVAAHRGGPEPGFPENAIATFAHTLSRAPALLEIDVAATRDGVLVLMHDDRLERTTTCEGAVADRTWAQLRECRLEDPDGRATAFPIPRLDEALAWADGRTVLELDIKSSVRYEDVVDAVRRAGAEERVILITYNAAGAARLAGLAPDLVISASVADLDELGEHEAGGVATEQILAWTGTRAPDPDLNADLDARDIPVIFGTLGDPTFSVDGEIARTGEEGRYRAIAAQGVDVIATDRPVQAHQALREERDATPALEACRSAP